MPPRRYPVHILLFPSSEIGGIVKQCHKAALVPKFHPLLYARAGVILELDILCRRYDDGLKHKGAFIFPAYGTHLLKFHHQPLHKTVPYMALGSIVPPHG